MSDQDPPREIVNLVSLLQEQFGWDSHGESYEVIEQWERPRSGSEFFRVRAQRDGPDVVIKRHLDWPEGMAERVYEATNRFAATVDGANLDHGRVIRALGWARNPETIVTPYVEGLDLVSVLRTPTHWAWEDEGELLAAWMVDAGAMLAIYHTDERISPKDRDHVWDEARALGRRVMASEQVEAAFDEMEPESCFKPAFGDYAPGNMHVTEDHHIHVLDGPEQTEHALIHRDLAHFLFETRRQLAGHGYTRTPPVAGQHYGRLAEAFLRGYSAEMPGPELGNADRFLVDLYQLRRSWGMARKRTPDRPTDAWWFASTALSIRWALQRGHSRYPGS